MNGDYKLTVLLPYLPAIIFGAGLIFGLYLSRLIYGYHQNQKIQGMLKGTEPHPPGFTHYLRIKRLTADIIYYSAVMVGIPCAIAAIHFLLESLAGPITQVNLMLIGGLTISASIVVMIKLIIALNQRRRLSLAYEAEVVVGKELDRLASSSYRIFHDVPADTSTIGHIVVGSKGVFMVETVSRPNPNVTSKNGSAIPVEYNGHVLFYPDGKDLKTLEKVADRASRLSDWLGHKIGEPIAIRSVVTLPGWTVKRTSANGIPVVNPKQFGALFEHIQPRYLSEEMICRIIEQLDQR
jgi:hypothetical protein